MYDTLIIGAGPAGMTAALYAAAAIGALLEAGIPGGQMNKPSDIEITQAVCQYPVDLDWLKDVQPLEALGVEHVR